MTRARDSASSERRGWVFAATSTEEVLGLTVAGGEVAVMTRTSPLADGNEDSALVMAGRPGSALLAVADGFGGAPAGERASRIAVEEMAARAFANRSNREPLRASILDGFEAANRKILELGVGAATTLAAVGIEGRAFRPFHSGDSTILVIGGRGKIKWASVAHSPAGYAVASGWIAEHEAREHDEAQWVSNYLGSTEMRIEIGPRLQLAPRDTVLVASDGLIDNVSPDELARTTARGRPLTAAVEELARRARLEMDLETGKPDDLTVVAFRPRQRPNHNAAAK